MISHPKPLPPGIGVAGPHDVEQALCRKALETHAYDSMDDSAWIALCEHVANEARLRERNEKNEADPQR